MGREDAGGGYVEGDGAGDEDVVVAAGGGGEVAVGELLVGGELVAGFGVGLDVEAVAHGFDEAGYDHRLRGAVGVEAGASGSAGEGRWLAVVEVGVAHGQAVEQEERGVA